jgi:serine/threonine-protein kinase
MGSHHTSVEELQQAMVRHGVLTNYQIDRLLQGYQSGFFYGDYKVLYSVGAGTFARVFRAVHRQTGEIYAVKVLRNRYSRELEQVEMFRREGEVGSTLVHPNIVQIHEVYSRGATHYLVMDFVEGQNLRDLYKVRRVFEPREATRLISDVASGLAYAYQKGVTHRDIKMSNVLIASDGRARLVDFGLAAREADVDLEKTSNPRTIDYAGLERATGVRRDDTRSDIYFVGCIYYQMLAGKAALVETRDRVQRLAKTRFKEIPPLVEVNPRVPLPLAMVVGKAIEFDPQRRYQNPAEMLTDLKLALKRIEEPEDGDGRREQQLESKEGFDDQGRPRTIMIIESDTKIQDLFRDTFKRHGYRVLVTNNPDRAVLSFSENPSAADVVLFSTGGIGEAAIEAFNDFGNHHHTQHIPALLLLATSHKEGLARARTAAHRGVASMPLKIRDLRREIVRLLDSVPEASAAR